MKASELALIVGGGLLLLVFLQRKQIPIQTSPYQYPPNYYNPTGSVPVPGTDSTAQIVSATGGAIAGITSSIASFFD